MCHYDDWFVYIIPPDIFHHCLPHPFPSAMTSSYYPGPSAFYFIMVFPHTFPPPLPSLIIERSKYSYKKIHNLFSNYYIKQGVKAFVSALPSKGLVLIILIWFNHEVMQKTLKSLYKTWCKGICERSVFGRFVLIILKYLHITHEVV